MTESRCTVDRHSWSQVIIAASQDLGKLVLLSDYLSEIDAAKEILHDKGYGDSTCSLIETVNLVSPA